MFCLYKKPDSGLVFCGRIFAHMIYLKRAQTCNRTGGFTFFVKEGRKWITPAWIEVPIETDFKDVIVEPEPPRVEAPPLTEKSWKFIGSKGNEYEVKRDKMGYTCTCPASLFQRNKECKHIKEAKTNG